MAAPGQAYRNGALPDIADFKSATQSIFLCWRFHRPPRGPAPGYAAGQVSHTHFVGDSAAAAAGAAKSIFSKIPELENPGSAGHCEYAFTTRFSSPWAARTFLCPHSRARSPAGSGSMRRRNQRRRGSHGKCAPRWHSAAGAPGLFWWVGSCSVRGRLG